MRIVAILLAASSMIVHRASAQEASLLMGGVHAEYGDSLSGDAGLVSFKLSDAASTRAGALEASFSQFTSGGWAVQLAGNGSAAQPLGRHAALGVVGSASLSNFEGGTWSGAGSAGPLLVVGAGGVLATLNAAVGGIRDVADSAFGFWVGSAGVRYRHVSGASVAAGITATSSDTTRYADATLGVSYEAPTFRVGVFGGTRAGDLADDPWGQARLEWFGSRRLGIEAAVGRYPRDLVGFTDGFFLTAGVRLRLAGSPAGARSARSPVRIERGDVGTVRLHVRYDGVGERLEIAGDWNGWTPVPMRRSPGGEWIVDLTLGPGLYQYSLVVDGDTWVVPDGVPYVPDEFGGTVGVLVVPERS